LERTEFVIVDEEIMNLRKENNQSRNFT